MSALAVERAHDAPLAAPTIKGIFVNSHVEAVRRALGPAGIARLEEAYGAPLRYRDLDDVPVRDEVRIIELANDLLSVTPIPDADRAYEGGRLHFKNFSKTPLARMTFAVFPRNFKYLMLHTKTIAERVFKGVKFETRELAPNHIETTMENNDYPLDHFRGLFQAWMDDFGYDGVVEARAVTPTRYVYSMRWTSP